MKQLDMPLVYKAVTQFLHQPARINDFDPSKFISKTCKVNLEGYMPVVYIDDIGTVVEDLRVHLDELHYSVSQRRNLGSGNKSILFGAVPPNIIKSNFCSFGAVADHNSLLHELLSERYSTVLQAILDHYLPGWSQVCSRVYKNQKIHSDYRMAKTIWTSGIINRNSPHYYHYDDMNVPKMMSAMITLKKDIDGGYLCIPTHRLAFEVKDRSAIFFSGKHILHGVTPIINPGKGSRTTVVYYTTATLAKCSSQEQELLKAIR